MSAIAVRDLRKAYGGVEAVRGISFAVEEGEVFGLLGPNGAGKTTMLQVLAGLHPASSGEVRIAGRDVTGADPTALARRGVCSIPEGRGVFPNLTVRENLWMVTYRGVSRADVEANAFERFPRLSERRDQAAGTLSGG